MVSRRAGLLALAGIGAPLAAIGASRPPEPAPPVQIIEGLIPTLSTFPLGQEVALAAGVQAVRTAGFARAGLGSAMYIADPALDDDALATRPASVFRAGKRLFRLAEAFPTPEMFGAVADGQTDTWPAFKAAIAHCTRHGAVLMITSGSFLLRPAGRGSLTLDCDMRGAGLLSSTLLCDVVGHHGPVFTLGSYRLIADLTLMARGTAPTAGLALRADKRATFSGHMRVEGVRIHGFETNILISNCYQWSLRDSILSAGGEGLLYDGADFTADSDSGYFNDGSIEGCMIADNRRNLCIDPPKKSANLFIGRGTAIQNARGTTEQALLKKIRPLRIEMLYGEGAPQIPLLRMSQCDATIDGCFMSGTGGIDVGADWSSTTLRQVTGASPSDAFVATGGVGQSVVVEDSDIASPRTRITSRKQRFSRSTLGAETHGERIAGMSLALSPPGNKTAALHAIDGAQTLIARDIAIPARAAASVATVSLTAPNGPCVAIATPDHALEALIFSASVGRDGHVVVQAHNPTDQMRRIPRGLSVTIALFGFEPSPAK
ncbi:hypothetical protein CVN68_21915 [Sphingomonas psychrotolerans]|uniref:Pectate lyase superfamily protein domain-containing protein n=2 Tax=Sphingomonas psychrotolerans TaxID=1327635 RepID=A0A2K8MK88_9SPHN|nr:hypothetical protein CVN68_21915 [Sphingomonas psychrotolerans]